jgi:hypothetical protein
MTNAVNPVPRNVMARREADLHSPVNTPDKVAVAIMKIWSSPHPIEVPREPRNTALIP